MYQKFKRTQLALAITGALVLSGCKIGFGNSEQPGASNTTPIPNTKPLKELTMPNTGLARLGILEGATVQVIDLHVFHPVNKQPIVTDSNGKFSLQSLTLNPDDYYLVQVTGGKDADPNGDGVKGEAPIENKSTLMTLATGRQIIENGVSVNILTDAMSRRLMERIEYNVPKKIQDELDAATKEFIDNDLNQDGKVSYLDALYFDPTQEKHKDSVSFDYTELYLKQSEDVNDPGESILDLYYANDEDLSNIIGDVFSEILPKISLLDEESAPYAALRFGVGGEGELTVEGLGKVIHLDSENDRYSQAVLKSSMGKDANGAVTTSQRIRLKATVPSGGKLIAWEGCEQDVTDPTVCYATPDKTKSVVANFDAPERLRENVLLVRVTPKAGELGLILNKGTAVLTMPKTNEAVARMDQAIASATADSSKNIFVAGTLFKQTALKVTSAVTRQEIKGIIRYSFSYQDKDIGDVLGEGSYYTNNATVNVDSIQSLKGGDGQMIKPKTEANEDDVSGPNPVDSVIDAALCGDQRVQLQLIDDEVGCVDENAMPVETDDSGEDPACDAGTDLTETLDGELFCIKPEDIHSNTQTQALSASIRNSPGYRNGQYLAANLQKHAMQLTQPVKTQTLKSSLKTGDVVWLAGYGKAIYMSKGVFMIDKPNGGGVSMITVDGNIQEISRDTRRAMAFQACNNNLNAAECQFFDSRQLLQARQRYANGQAVQGKLLPIDIYLTIVPEKYQWLTFRFRTNAELSANANANFDFSVWKLFYDFSSRGVLTVKPYLNTIITAEGEARFSCKYSNDPAKKGCIRQDKKPNSNQASSPAAEKEIVEVDIASKIPNPVVQGAMSMKMKVGVGLGVEGQAKLEIHTDYKQVIAWDVKSEYRVNWGRNTNNQWFRITSRGYPGATIKGDLNAALGAYAYAKLVMGPRAIEELIELDARFYLLKLEGQARFMTSMQTDPDAVAKQNGQNFCMAGDASVALKTGAVANAKIQFKSSEPWIDTILDRIGFNGWSEELWKWEKVLFTIGTEEDASGNEKPNTFTDSIADSAVVKGVKSTFTPASEAGEEDPEALKCTPPDPANQPDSLTMPFMNLEAGRSVYTKTHELTLQTDGNLVIYNWNGTRNNPIWSTGTNGMGNYGTVKIEDDGNLIVRDIFNNVKWASNTWNSGVTKARLNRDGELQLLSNDNVIWSSTGNTSRQESMEVVPNAGFELKSNQARITKNRTLILQKDGNLVIYALNDNGSTNRALWSSGTSGIGEGARAVFQADGNFVVYDKDGRARWSSGTYGRGATRLFLQPDGNLVIYSNNGALWASGTN